MMILFMEKIVNICVGIVLMGLFVIMWMVCVLMDVLKDMLKIIVKKVGNLEI